MMAKCQMEVSPQQRLVLWWDMPCFRASVAHYWAAQQRQSQDSF